MDDEKKGWKKLRKASFDKASLAKRAQRAETATTRHAHKFIIQRLASIRDVSRRVTIWLVVIAILLIAVMMQFMWFEKSYKTTAAFTGGTYAEATLGPIETLNPLYARTSAELSADRLIFSSLFDYDKTGHLRSDVASSITASDDGKSYTVTLRRDVKWHDNTNLTAEDVVYTVGAMKNPSARSVMQSSWEDINAEALNEHTVRFTLPSAYAAFPQALTFLILPSHILADIDPGALRQSPFNLSPVGSGPFTLRLLQVTPDEKDHKIVFLSRWDDYYHGPVQLSRFELHAYSSTDAIHKALTRRDVNAATDTTFSTKDLPSGYQVDTHSIDSGVYALLNNESETLADQNIRAALQVGTNTDEVRNALPVRVPKLDYPFLPQEVQNVSLAKKPDFSQEKASALLDKAGWKRDASTKLRKKGNQTLRLRVVALKDSQYEIVTKNLAKQWQSLGIDVSVQLFDSTASAQSFSQAILQPRAYDILINELVLGADPDVFAYWHSTQANPVGLNFSNYRSGVADDALASARLRSEKDLRALKYKAFSEQWMNDAPAIALYQSVSQYAHSEQTTATQAGAVLPAATDRYTDVRYWSAGRTQVYKTP